MEKAILNLWKILETDVDRYCSIKEIAHRVGSHIISGEMLEYYENMITLIKRDIRKTAKVIKQLEQI